MGKHADLPRKPFPGYWDMPGGKLFEDESLEENVKREAKEETGLDTVSLKLVGVFHSTKDKIASGSAVVIPGLAVCYELKTFGTIVSTELEDLHWVTPEELKTLKLTPWSEYFLKDF